MAFIRDGYGQIDVPTDTAATSTPVASLLPFYLIATAAGLTVWFLTRWLGKGKR